MKKVLVLMVAVACALPVVTGAQMDNARLLQMFSSTARTEGGNLQIVLLNDKTIEVVFGSSPAKAAFRSKARSSSLFFVQGTAIREFAFTPEATLTQKGETFPGKATPMKNFAAGKIARGDQLQGLVEFPAKLDLYEPFKITISGASADFRFNADDVRDYGNR